MSTGNWSCGGYDGGYDHDNSPGITFAVEDANGDCVVICNGGDTTHYSADTQDYSGVASMVQENMYQRVVNPPLAESGIEKIFRDITLDAVRNTPGLETYTDQMYDKHCATSGETWYGVESVSHTTQEFAPNNTDTNSRSMVEKDYSDLVSLVKKKLHQQIMNPPLEESQIERINNDTMLANLRSLPGLETYAEKMHRKLCATRGETWYEAKSVAQTPQRSAPNAADTKSGARVEHPDFYFGYKIFNRWVNVTDFRPSEWMTHSEILHLVKPGDILEFRRGKYCHFAMVSEHKGMVYNIPAEDKESTTTIITLESVKDVCMGGSKKSHQIVRINNLEGYAKSRGLHARSTEEALAAAREMLGKEIPYRFAGTNCEYYSTLWKYGTGFSEQVTQMKAYLIEFLELYSRPL